MQRVNSEGSEDGVRRSNSSGTLSRAASETKTEMCLAVGRYRKY